MNSSELAGIGMTSQRTRERLIQRLKDQGISNQRILDVFRVTPRHIFLDEALSHRFALKHAHHLDVTPPAAVDRHLEQRQRADLHLRSSPVAPVGYGAACMSVHTLRQKITW